MLNNIKEDESEVIGEFNGFEVLFKKEFYSSDKGLILRGNRSYPISISNSSHGNMVKLENILKGFEKKVGTTEIKIDEINRNLNQAMEEFKKQFSHKEKFSMLLKKQLELNMNKECVMVVDE